VKTYVIYNPNDKVSLELVGNTISDCKSNGLSPILFAGTFNNDIELKLERYKITPSNLCIDMSKGTKGCFISHYELWQLCAEGEETFLILEHDVAMINSLPNNVEELFDEILHLDYCGSKQKNLDEYLQCVDQKYDLKIINPFKQIPAILNTWQEAKKNNIPGGYAYLIKSSAAKKLLEATKKYGFLPADVHINNCYIDLKTISPSVFRICEFMIDRKNKTKFSSTKGYLYGKS
jgi:GR25 family glycosyltransferase involved in LPS biosynthesis